MQKLTKSQSIFLNALRLIATVFLVVGHGLGFFSEKYQLLVNNNQLIVIQNVAVILFMILSGFLTVYSLSLRKSDPSYSFTKYFITRCKRIIPELYVAIAISMIIDFSITKINGSFVYQPYFNFVNLGASALFLQGSPRFHFEPIGSMRQLWTLSIEWWLYMSFAWFWFKIRVNNGKSNLKNTLIWLALSILPIYNLSTFFINNQRSIVIYWLLGVVGAIVFQSLSKLKLSKSFILSSSAIVVLFVIRRIRFNHEAYDLTLSILFMALIIGALIMLSYLDVKGRGLGVKLLNLIVKYTYSIYLVHYSVMYFFSVVDLGLSNNEMLIGSLIGSVVLSIVTFHIAKLCSNLFTSKGKLEQVASKRRKI